MKTVQAEINVNGVVTLLERVKIKRKARAKLIIYDETSDASGNVGNAAELLALMRSKPLPAEAAIDAKEMELQIEEARDSWD